MGGNCTNLHVIETLDGKEDKVAVFVVVVMTGMTTGGDVVWY